LVFPLRIIKNMLQSGSNRKERERERQNGTGDTVKCRRIPRRKENEKGVKK
jgi:hypothetical protein